MHYPKFVTLLLSSVAVLSFAQTPASTAAGDLKGPQGAALGHVTVTETPRGVLLRVEAKGLTPGWHGMHFHEKGSCDDPAFKDAGAHVHATTPVVHGLLHEGANDAGDLPNLFVTADGTATAEFFSTLVSLKGESGRPALLDSDGSALVIHASPDDYQSQPIGGSGARIACAVLR